MILFYSDYCQHCSVLLETIKKHDINKTIKLVSIDNIRNTKINIDSKIHSVPALMFLPSKEIIFGKNVFDYLLLPNRGYLFQNKNTRTEKTSDNPPSSINSPIPMNNTEEDFGPSAFSLGRISSDIFSSITDDDNNSMNVNNDKVYNWTSIQDKSNDNDLVNIAKKYNENTKKPMPSLDQIQRERDNALKD
jgi:hypothetical protein